MSAAPLHVGLCSWSQAHVNKRLFGMMVTLIRDVWPKQAAIMVQAIRQDKVKEEMAEKQAMHERQRGHICYNGGIKNYNNTGLRELLHTVTFE